MRDDPTVVDLVLRARKGDNSAWDEIVERYAPLIWSICRRYQLIGPEAEDVGQTVWLRVVEHLAVINEPAALPGWIATTTRRVCLGVVRAKQQRDGLVTAAGSDPTTTRPAISVDEPLLVAERNAVVRAAFAQLSPGCQQLLSLLAHDPPLTYAEISARLGAPIGGLGPRRARCLERLRRCPPLAALIEASTRTMEGGEGNARPMVER
jgi:RNA polymerase sigma factor (sigma-70 family)